MAQRARHLQRQPDPLSSSPRTEVEGKGDTIRTNTYTSLPLIPVMMRMKMMVRTPQPPLRNTQGRQTLLFRSFSRENSTIAQTNMNFGYV